MKRPKPVTLMCDSCHQAFLAEVIDEYEYNENGDDRLIGYHHRSMCDTCVEEENKIPRDSKKWGKILYQKGLITKDEMERIYKK